MTDTTNHTAPLKRGTRDHAYWLADKIPAFGDYGKECAETLRMLADRLIETEAMVEELKDGPFSESWEAFRSQCASAIAAKDAALDALTREAEGAKGRAPCGHPQQALVDDGSGYCLWCAQIASSRYLRDELTKTESTIASQSARIATLEAEARRFYRGDGTYEDLATPEEVIERRKEAAARIATLEDALGTAKEAMAERRQYASDWEWNYHEVWDGEDAKVSAALTPSKGER